MTFLLCVSWCLLSSAQGVAQTINYFEPARKCNKHFIALLDLTEAERRSLEDSEVIYALKNVPHAKPQTFIFTDEFYETNPHDRTPWTQGNLYHETIRELRTGDTLKIMDEDTGAIQTFQLGEYLGGGNATHVWALQDNPDLALRIPYGVVTRFGRTDALRFMKKFNEMAKDLPDEFPRANVVTDGKGRFSVVTRLHSQETGTEFMKKISGSGTNSRGQLIIPGAEDRKKLEQLIDFTNRFAQFSRAYDEAYTDPTDLKNHRELWYNPKLIASKQTIELLARQIIWDLKSQKWVLVDWE